MCVYVNGYSFLIPNPGGYRVKKENKEKFKSIVYTTQSENVSPSSCLHSRHGECGKGREKNGRRKGRIKTEIDYI